MINLASGLITFPWYYCHACIKQILFRFPINVQGNGFQKTVDYKDPNYLFYASYLPGMAIKQAIEGLAKQVGLRNDLIVTEGLNVGFCASVGVHAIKSSQITMLLAPGFYATDSDSCLFIMKHELHHILSNDPLMMKLVPMISQLALFALGLLFLNPLISIAVTLPITLVVDALFSRFREEKADDFAIAHSTDKELRGARRFFHAVLHSNFNEPESFYKRISYTEDGESIWDFWHPSLKSRIDKVEKALRDRNKALTGDMESTKQRDLNFLMEIHKRRIYQALSHAQ